MDALTMEEIRNRFDAEWVLVGDPETTANHEVMSGRVLFHSKDRDEVYRKAREIRPARSAILYLGRLPREAVVILITR